MKPKTELTRTVKSSGGTVSVDLSYKKPGRGAYICKNKNCLKRVIKSNALTRALKIKIPENIIDELNVMQEKISENES